MSDTPTTWEEAAIRERGRLTEPHTDKKWATILAIVKARITPGQSEADVWRKRKDDPDFGKTICSKNIYDSKWRKETSFIEVLQRVQTLAEGWETAESLRKLKEQREQEQTAWRNKMKGLATMGADNLELMLKWPIERQQMITEHYPDGRPKHITIIEPADWGYRNIPSLFTAVDKAGRLALDMDTDRKRELSWEDEVIALIREGKVDFEELARELASETLAREFFTKAGVNHA